MHHQTLLIQIVSKMKTLIKFPTIIVENLKAASNETAGAVFKAIMEYVATGNDPEGLAPDVACIFLFAKQFIKLPKQLKKQEASAPAPQPVDSPVADVTPVADAIPSPEIREDSWQMLTCEVPIFDTAPQFLEYLKTLPDEMVYQIYREYDYLGKELCRQNPEKYPHFDVLKTLVRNTPKLVARCRDKAECHQFRKRFDEIRRARLYRAEAIG